ncbi:MAG: alanine:cation symporter family protein [Firmicutes bacterium]|nr:alanine:cation symporter family protein [Bacillota bacterium]
MAVPALADEEVTFADNVAKVNDSINSFVWTAMLFAILGVGLIMTVITSFFQFTHFGYWWQHSIGSVFKRKDVLHSDDKKSISQFQSLCTAMAATVGTGNIVGVATAIVSGGPGAIFWMWIAAILGLMTNFSENVLGIFYRRRNKNGEWSGGAMYYLKDGLGGKKGFKQVGAFLAGLFAVFAVLASFGIGNLSQINSIVTNVTSTLEGFGVADQHVGSFSLIHLITGLVLMIVAALVIVGGLQRIAQTAEKLVPFMAIAYILGSLVLIFWKPGMILPALGSIFKFAFTGRAIAGGTLGTVIKWGLKRGVFSNEAGLGSSVMVHSNSNAKEPVTQGIWGIFEVFADTIIICTLTALAILTSGYIDFESGQLVDQAISASALTNVCFSAVFGKAGSVFVTLALVLFAFSTVLGWSHYVSKSWEYLLGTKSTIIYRVVFILCIMLGAQMTSSLAWDISDTFNGLMALPNLIGVLACAGTVAAIVKNYKDRVFHGKDIEPMLSWNQEIQKEEEIGFHTGDD